MNTKITTYFSLLFILLFLKGTISFGQNSTFKNIHQLIRKGKNNEAIDALKKMQPNTNDPCEKCELYYLKATAYSNTNQNDKSLANYIESQHCYKLIDSISRAYEINLDIANLLITQEASYASAKAHTKEYLDYAEKAKDINKICLAYHKWASLLIEEQPKESKRYFFRALQLIKKTKNDKLYGDIASNLGVLYNEKFKLHDSALFYYQKSLEVSKKYNDVDAICQNLINQSAVYSYQKNYAKAIALLNEADQLPLTAFVKKTKAFIQKNLSENYVMQGDYKKGYTALYISDSLEEKTITELQNKKILELQTKYESQKKELENLNLKSNIQTNRIITYFTLGLLVLSILIGLITYNSLARKKKIVEQEKLLGIQKLETTLKEQELHEIDLMLESQEKERQNIANELHDNLGSMLATLKLNFENLKLNGKDSAKNLTPLYEKTDRLIEEAYQKVRTISHLKNLGVIGSEGLVVAVKTMAEKMSILDKLRINVIPHGLKERLENTLEITLYRIIQELCTNIIKHSEAREVNIYLTQHSSSELNIIIEDNGKGFNPKKIVEKSGIGLKSIEKKVEQLNGTFTIDSIISKGTTIIIDIPI